MPPPTACRLLPTAFQTRWLCERDLEAVLAIEEASFEFPWSRGDFVKVFRSQNCLGKVVEVYDAYLGCEVVAGYVVFELLPGSIAIMNLAVDPKRRRQGAGSTIIRYLRHKAMQGPRSRGIVCDVRESNLAAQLFLRACGFRAGQTIRDMYEETDEDAYRFSLVP